MTYDVTLGRPKGAYRTALVGGVETVLIHPDGKIIPRRGVYTSETHRIEDAVRVWLKENPLPPLTAEEYCDMEFTPDIRIVCQLLKLAGRPCKSYDAAPLMRRSVVKGRDTPPAALGNRSHGE